MPVYEYECKKCGVFEVEQSIKDNALKTCPTCKGKKLQRLISRTLFTLKGGGWYSQGYGSGKPASSEGGSKPSGESPAKSEGSAKSENTSKSESPAKSESSAKAESPAKAESSSKTESAAKSESPTKPPKHSKPSGAKAAR